jgi:glyoxylase-like metal-dependent hydrolase (beta-lactamase superfamily II)
MKNFILTTITIAVAITGSHAQGKKVGNIYTFESDGNGFNTKTIFYDDGKEVVAFDAQFTPGVARQAIEFLRSKTKNPIKFLVVTHPNPDKFNGISAFKEAGAKVVMSALSARNMPQIHEYKKYYFVNIAKSFTDETYPHLPTADITFNDTHSLQMAGGGKVELKELGMSGISTNQTVASITTHNALVVGDLVHHHAHAWLEGPIVDGKPKFSSQNWIKCLEFIQQNYKGTVDVFGGRGDVDLLSKVVPAQIAYLNTAVKITKEYVNATVAAKAEIDYGKLQTIFEAKFPDYRLGYMIAYGAYGIAASVQ